MCARACARALITSAAVGGAQAPREPRTIGTRKKSSSFANAAAVVQRRASVIESLVRTRRAQFLSPRPLFRSTHGTRRRRTLRTFVGDEIDCNWRTKPLENSRRLRLTFIRSSSAPLPPIYWATFSRTQRRTICRSTVFSNRNAYGFFF